MKYFLLLVMGLAGLPAAFASSFLPIPDQPVRYSGVQWNDDWDAESPVEVEGKWTLLAKLETGEYVQLKLQSSGQPTHPRDWPAQTFWVTPQGAIFRVSGENVSKPPQLDPFDIVVPEFDEARHFANPPKATEETQVTTSDRGWRWVAHPWTTEINTDDGSLVRFHASHPSGHFTKFVWQRDLGLTELAMGSGADQDGWSLHRSVAPAGKIAKEDITGLLAALPDEFIPVGDALKNLTVAERAAFGSADSGARLENLNARVDVDRTNGWFRLTSNTDGEGENLDAVLWKRANGSRLIALLLQQWSSGPNHTRALRVAEYRDGRFHHVTTSLPLPAEGDFYTEEEAAKRPPGGLIEGVWNLPRRGTTITIRPPNEEAADLMPESMTSDESYFFELIWDGAAFGSVKLPRLIPPLDWEPKEWAFQCGGSVPGALFLKREGTILKGELFQPGKTRAVRAEIDADGQSVAFTIDGESAGATRLVNNGDTGVVWNGLAFTEDFATDEEVSLEAIPREPEAPALPRYKILGADGVYYPRFQSAAPAWKAINEKIAAMVEKERKFYRSARKPAKDEASFGNRFRIMGVCENTFSLLMSFDYYLGGPHGQSVHTALNYDFKGKRFLKLADVLEAKNNAKLADLLNQSLARQEIIAEGQDPVSAETVAELPWALEPGNEVTFHFAPETLFSNTPEATVTLGWEQLNEAGLIRAGGPLDPDPQ